MPAPGKRSKRDPSPEQVARLRPIMERLLEQYGPQAKLGARLGFNQSAVSNAVNGVSASYGIAVEACKLARVPLSAVLGDEAERNPLVDRIGKEKRADVLTTEIVQLIARMRGVKSAERLSREFDRQMVLAAERDRDDAFERLQEQVESVPDDTAVPPARESSTTRKRRAKKD